MNAVRSHRIYSFGRSACRLFTSVFCDLKVYGAHNVPASGGVLLVSNHESFLDPPMIGAQLRRPVSYFAKSELFQIPLFGWLIYNLHAFPVRQGTGDISAVREAIRRLQEGNVLTIFPEGSRSPDGNFQPVAPGVSLIIRRTQAPVVPVCVSGSFQAWPRHRAMFRCHPCRVLFRPPIRLAHLQPAEIVATIERTWREMKEELKKRG